MFLVNIDAMQVQKISDKVKKLVKSALVAAVLPVFIVYILVGKPDYRIMNGVAHVVVPVGRAVGDLVTWPVRAVGRGIENLRDLSRIRSENEELRVRLDAALRNKNECEIAIVENLRLAQELGVSKSILQKTVITRIVADGAVFSHKNFLLDKGANSGIEPGMAVVDFENNLVGMVIDAGKNFSRVRGLSDAKSSVPVRIAGSEVYGFLGGNGTVYPRLDFISDPLFQVSEGLRLVTSGINGVLPDGIPVGVLRKNKSAQITDPGKSATVMVLGFDGKERYKN